jgi:NADPH2:quinone reductase
VLEISVAGSGFVAGPALAVSPGVANELSWRANDLFAACRSGELTVAIDRILPLADAGDAHRLLKSRATRGKLLLAVPGD